MTKVVKPIKFAQEHSSLDAKRADAFLQTYGAYSATVGEDTRSTEESVTLDSGEVKRSFFHEVPLSAQAT